MSRWPDHDPRRHRLGRSLDARSDRAGAPRTGSREVDRADRQHRCRGTRRCRAANACPARGDRRGVVAMRWLKELLAGSGVEATLAGAGALAEAATMGADWTMAAIVGSAGPPAGAGQRFEAGSTVALANKEALVCAGALVKEGRRAWRCQAATGRSRPIMPQVPMLADRDDAPERVRRIILTCSGGPFRDKSIEEIRAATPAEAVRHPIWSMGAKISAGYQATRAEQALELIEARHLLLGPRRSARHHHPSATRRSSTAWSNMSTARCWRSSARPDMRIADRPCARLAGPHGDAMRAARPCPGRPAGLYRTLARAFSGAGSPRAPRSSPVARARHR